MLNGEFSADDDSGGCGGRSCRLPVFSVNALRSAHFNDHLFVMVDSILY